MKPMHGVNNGPLTCNFQRDARPLFKEAGIPFSRLHDTEYPFGSGEFVDVPCIFKNFNADVNDPESYDFTLTDLYLKAILECGTKIIYRLGTSIEHNPIKIRVHPPKDFKKWAQICEHIIMHVNEGWANGYHMGIEYWEIWNEPDVGGQKMWTGTVEQFAELYTVTATHLKNRFPNLKIGGPALCSAKNAFAEKFFTLITANGARPPMDFYSWHGYCHTVDYPIKLAHTARELLDSFGYTEAESIYDEWNYVYSWQSVSQSYKIMRSQAGAAFFAAVIASLQSTPCDIATFYDAQLKFEDCWCPIFKTSENISLNGEETPVVPTKGYFGFKAFNEVYKCREQTELEIGDDRIYGVAAHDGENGAVMLVSYADPCDGDEVLESKEITVDISGSSAKNADIYICNEEKDLELAATTDPSKPITLTLTPYSFVLIKVR